MNKKLINLIRSPSLSIFKPSLNSIFSILNRILGVLLYIYIIVNIIFNINNYNLYNIDKEFIDILKYLNIFFIYIFFFHILYSIFKMSIKYEKNYKTISNKIYIIDNIYIWILFLNIILFIILYLYYFDIIILNNNIIEIFIDNFIKLLFILIIMFNLRY